jgi:hypothetical protein
VRARVGVREGGASMTAVNILMHFKMAMHLRCESRGLFLMFG